MYINRYLGTQYEKGIINNKIKNKTIILIKRAAIGITALITSLSSSGMKVYADYDPCDVNHDNSVDMADVLCITYYLNGNWHNSNYNLLDANRDLIVDIKDKECVQAKILQLTYNTKYYSRNNKSYNSPTVSGFIPDGVSGTNSPRSYIKHSYLTNNNSSYQLTLPANIASINEQEPETSNNRFMEPSINNAENSGIVHIGGSDGTGFIIGNHEIATAAHCVYNSANSSFYSITIQTYDADGILTGNTLTPKECHIPTEYTYFSPDAYDYAVITVSDDLSNNDNYVKFNLGTSYNMSASDFSSIPIYVTGCPKKYHTMILGDPYHLINWDHNLYTDECHIVDNSNLPLIVFTNSDTYSGQSGSPIYTISKQTIGNNEKWYYTAIGIHHGYVNESTDCGSRITEHHLMFYKHNSYLSY